MRRRHVAHLLSLVCCTLALLIPGPGIGGTEFEAVTEAVGIKGFCCTEVTWGDFDNDGWVDVYSDVLWRNKGGTFVQVDGPFEGPGIWGDYDNDGDLDLATSGILFRNPGNGNRWLKVRLKGNGVNAFAIGAQVRIPIGNRRITRQVDGGTGEGNQNDLTLHFGLGSQADPVEIEVRWPDGTKQVQTSEVDRTVEIVKK